MAEILEPTDYNITKCKEHLECSEVVAVPTETVYGLAANALDEVAVKKIFEIKKRPLIDPLIVHVHSSNQTHLYAELNILAQKLIKEYWPGPLTLVLKKKSKIPDLVTASLPSVAIRSPQHPTFRKLLKALSFPLAAPSANPFGYISPTQTMHVQHSLGENIRYILNGGYSKLGIESTIIDVQDENKPTILRPGPITRDELEQKFNRTFFSHNETSRNSVIPAPGLLDNHYSPKKPLMLVEEKDLQNLLSKNEHSKLKNCAIILNKRPKKLKAENLFWLSENGDLNEISKNLYHTLRQIDESQYSKLYIQEIEMIHLGVALMDRIRKAAN